MQRNRPRPVTGVTERDPIGEGRQYHHAGAFSHTPCDFLRRDRIATGCEMRPVLLGGSDRQQCEIHALADGVGNLRARHQIPSPGKAHVHSFGPTHNQEAFSDYVELPRSS